MLNYFLAPIVLVPGPHDLLHLGSELFEEFFGEFYTVYENDYIKLVAVNSSEIDTQEGMLGRGKLSRILSDLKDTKKIKIVAFHHHVVPIPHTRERFVLTDAGDVLRFNVLAALNLTKSETVAIAKMFNHPGTSFTYGCPMLREIHKKHPHLTYPSIQRVLRETRAGILEPSQALKYVKSILGWFKFLKEKG